MCGAAGGINFDAKLRRESTDVNDLFYGHISGMDALARGLRNAAQMLEVIQPFCIYFLPLFKSKHTFGFDLISCLMMVDTISLFTCKQESVADT